MNQSTRTTRRTAVAICCLLALAVAVVFGQTVQHEFINYDDNVYVYNNPQVAHGLTAQAIAWSFTSFHAANWHPLTWLSHEFDCQLYGTQHPGLHHLTNVLLHAAVVIALFLVLWRMTGSLWPSAFVAAVFAVHPLRVESVAWVSERKDLLSGLFFMLTLGAYLRYVRHPFSWGRYLLVVAIFALGLLAKPMLVTLPFVLLLLDYWPLGRLTGRSWGGSCTAAPGATVQLSPQLDRGRQECLPHLIVEKLPLLLLAGASCMVTSVAQRGAIIPVDMVPIQSRIANALVSYVAYIGQFFCPTGLALFYPYPDQGLPLWKVVGAAAALVGISVAAVLARRRLPYLFVGWFWYVGMLVPVIGLVQVGLQAMADRYTYLPQIGLCTAVTWTAAAVGRKFLSGGRIAALRPWAYGVACALLLAGLAACGWRQTALWKNSETIWTYTLAHTTNNVFAHNNLGAALAKRDATDAAIAHFQKATALSPTFAMSYANLAAALDAKGQSDAAAVAYMKADLSPCMNVIYWSRKALETNPNSWSDRLKLGNALAGCGELEQAATEYRQVTNIRPDCAVAHNNLANVLLTQRRSDEAITEYRKAIALNPNYADACNNLGTALANRGEFDAAIAQFRRAVQIAPALASAHGNLGMALSKQGKIDEAMVHWRERVRLRPSDPHGLSQLAWAMATRPEPSVQNAKEAVELARWAVELSHSREPVPLSTLAAAYARAGRFADAVKTAKKALTLALRQKNQSLANSIKAQLALYESHTPYLETTYAPPATRAPSEREKNR
ncbi:MAG: tetratricopeptide repeat protein [Thermoguttaceae bacterium]